MPIDYLKKGDLSAYKQNIDKLNRSLYSEVKAESELCWYT